MKLVNVVRVRVSRWGPYPGARFGFRRHCHCATLCQRGIIAVARCLCLCPRFVVYTAHSIRVSLCLSVTSRYRIKRDGQIEVIFVFISGVGRQADRADFYLFFRCHGSGQTDEEIDVQTDTRLMLYAFRYRRGQRGRERRKQCCKILTVACVVSPRLLGLRGSSRKFLVSQGSFRYRLNLLPQLKTKHSFTYLLI